MTTHVVLGAGPVGRAVVASLTTRGITPAVVTRSGHAVPGATSRRADLTDPAAAAAAVADAEVVFQCAQPAYHRWPQEFRALQSRVIGAAAAAGALLVVAENVYGYGVVPGPLTEALPLSAETRKGQVRAQMWRDLSDAHRAGQVRVVAGRASDFFGPGVTASAVGARFFTPIVRGKPVPVAGDPDRRHTYTYVPDFGEALVRLSETPATWGRAWHVPNPATVTTREFAERAATLAAEPLRLRPVRPWQLRLLGTLVPAARETVEMLYQFDDDHVVDHTAYAAVLGDHATALDDALAATIAAYAAPLRPATR
ncbi:NAD-dependent epimerase/dehydratase family protein [Rhodococcus sp. NPDC003318]|uniref:NAD-dependent epimerase/dehydratase family protein n=1 Tax=Rhodococcus sp. NPDC003318 TaxID=3364503 RepID=UPI00367584A6